MRPDDTSAVATAPNTSAAPAMRTAAGAVEIADAIVDRFLSATMPGLRSSLARLWSPPAVTIVGASTHRASSWLVKNLTRPESGFTGPIHLVNPRRSELFDRPCVPTIDDVDGEIGLAIVLLNPENSVAALTGASRSPDVACVYTEGFSVDAGGPMPMAQLADWGRARGAPLIGPGFAGMVSGAAGLFGMMSGHPENVIYGPVGLVLQSGGLMSSTARELMGMGYGLGRCMAYGKAALVGVTEFCLDVLASDDVEILGCYAETAPTTDGLRAIGQVSQLLGKPVVLLVPGTSTAGQLAARSHTGALATPRRLLEGVAHQYGIGLVSDVTEMIMSIDALLTAGRRQIEPPAVGLFAVSGGAGIVSADAIGACGVDMPEPTEATREVLAEEEIRATYNPFDAGAISLDDNVRYQRLVDVFSRDPNFGVVAAVSGVGLAMPGYEGHIRQGNTFVDTVRATGKPAVLAGPVNQDLSTAVSWAGVIRAPGSRPLGVVLRALCDWSKGSVGVLDERHDGDGEPAVDVEVVSGVDAQPLLDTLPLRWPRTALVTDARETTVAGFAAWMPVVIKTESGLAHRAVHGGVLPGLRTAESLARGIEFLLEQFAGAVGVSEEVEHQNEYFVGLDRHPQDGAIIGFGTGGARLGERTEMRAAPLDRRQAEALVAQVLGGSPAAKPAVALILAISDLARSRNEFQSIDLNPIVFDGPGSIVILDAKVHVDRRAWKAAA
jgi:acetate---CoA ligase (ADP-forming)